MGWRLGVGFGVAAACDITIASDQAKFGTPEINLGLWPMMISTVLLPLVPRKQLLEMMLVGRIIDAAEARELGVVTRVVSSEHLDSAVDEIVGQLRSKVSGRAGPWKVLLLRHGGDGPRYCP